MASHVGLECRTKAGRKFFRLREALKPCQAFFLGKFSVRREEILYPFVLRPKDLIDREEKGSLRPRAGLRNRSDLEKTIWAYFRKNGNRGRAHRQTSGKLRCLFFEKLLKKKNAQDGWEKKKENLVASFHDQGGKYFGFSIWFGGGTGGGTWSKVGNDSKGRFSSGVQKQIHGWGPCTKDGTIEIRAPLYSIGSGWRGNENRPIRIKWECPAKKTRRLHF